MVATTFKIEGTGGTEGDFLFNHLIFTEEEYNKIENLDKIIEEKDIDFVSVEREGNVTYCHITAIDNYDSIDKQGLIYSQNSVWVGDLGRGIYAVQKDDFKAIDNLKTYVAETIEDDSILIVKGNYTGRYNECVHGYGHEGYIVFKESTNNINDLVECSVDDFLLNY